MATRFLAQGGIPLPNGARLVEASQFRLTMVAPQDTLAERLVLDVNGRNIQILRYNQDDSDVVVYVGNKARMMHMDNVTGYIGKEVQ